MKRKYDKRNKTSFLIIVILSVLVVGIFSLFIYNYTKASKIEYDISADSVLQDVEKNYFQLDSDAKLKIRWNGNYYLIYNDEKIELGNKVIIYNTVSGEIKLYGTFYEITSEGKVVKYKDETILENTTFGKFYKLDDREYLLVDKNINSDDKTIAASNYLLVELDRLGNAKLSNNKINLKTINPTKLLTANYSFDIANEILNFGKYDIDLKKIIGSSNEYEKEEVDISPDGNGNGTGEGNATTGGDGSGNNNGNGTTNNTTGTGSGNVEENSDIGTSVDVNELIDKVKMTSIIRVVEGLNSIDFDYVIYDPYGEYQKVYVEVVLGDDAVVKELSKTDTHITIDGLTADTKYRFNFIYTTIDRETRELVPYTFESLDLSTKKPEYGVSVYKISTVYNTLTYKLNLQKGFVTNEALVNLSFDYNVIDATTGETTKKSVSLDDSVKIDSLDKSVFGTFNISGYNLNSDTLLKLTIVNIKSGEKEIPIDASYTFRFGR